jgi:hypothetical protein
MKIYQSRCCDMDIRIFALLLGMRTWVHITMGNTHISLPSKIVFAVDHDLVVVVKFVSFPVPVFVLTCHRQQGYDSYDTVRLELASSGFTTGAPHPLFSTHIY